MNRPLEYLQEDNECYYQTSLQIPGIYRLTFEFNLTDTMTGVTLRQDVTPDSIEVIDEEYQESNGK